MGKCQGGFCEIEVAKILARELHIPLAEVRYDKPVILWQIRGKQIMKTYDMIIIGGGSAGMSAAVSAKAQGIRKILILERSEELGGILQQCIHNALAFRFSMKK